MLSKLIKAMIEDMKSADDIKNALNSRKSIMKAYEKYQISYGIMKEEDEETEAENIRRHEWNRNLGK